MNLNINLLCNETHTKIDWKFPVSYITDEIQFEDFCLHPNPEQVDAILIVPELDWWGDDSPSFEGLEFIQRLRLIGKFSCPILVISEFDESDLGYLQTSNQIGFWADPAVKYSPLLEIFDKDSLSLLEHCGDGLDEVLMTDVCESIYKAQGVIREIFHNLKGLITRSDKIDEIILWTNSYFKKFSRLFPSNKTEIETLAKQFINELTNGSVKNYHSIVARYQDIILEFLDEEDQIINSSRDNLPSIEVLYIDDEKEKCLQLAKLLGQFEINCQYTTNPLEALGILKKDKSNHIKTVICDYRFYNSLGVWHRMQGYHVKNEIMKLPRVVSIILLSGYLRIHKSTILNNYMKGVSIFFKDDVFSESPMKGLIPLVGTIIEQHKENDNILSGMGNFNEKQRIYYKKHIQSTDFIRWENSAYKIAFDFVKNASETKLFKDIPGYVLRQYKGQLKGKDEAKNLENFRNKLMGRRIALGLCQLKNSQNNNKAAIQEMWLYHYSALTMGVNKIHSVEKDLHDLFNTHLRLSITEGYHIDELDKYPLTLEEKNWLTHVTPLLINGEDFIKP